MIDFKKRIENLKEKLNPEKIKKEIQEIGKEAENPAFWQNQPKATEAMKKMAEKQKELGEIEELETLLAAGQIPQLEKKLTQLELKTFLADEYDRFPAVFSIHAGQGGTEAMDWAEMLKRMYLRYFEKKDWSYELVEETLGDEAGIKNATILVGAPYSYGYLKYEAGTHRLVRQSPFNADRLRQTSFALVEVLPQIEEGREIEIDENELEWEFFRSSSQGGQNVQKVSTAVRLRHQSSGIVITCQAQRYQEQNRKLALQLLKAKLWGLRQAQAKQEEQKLKGGRTKATWGTQIRSYILHPYKMIKDLRTGWETADVEAVLNGELDGLIEAEIKTMVG